MPIATITISQLDLGHRTMVLQDPATDSLSDPTDTAFPVVYYAKYRSVDGVTISRALPCTVTASEHQGVSAGNGLPKMGGYNVVTAVVGTAPWTASDFVDFYRKVTVRDTEEVFYYLVGTDTNTGTVQITDTYTDYELINSSSLTALTEIEMSGALLSSSTTIPYIVGGNSWKGSCVLFNTSGFAFFSRTGSYSEYLWPDVTIELQLTDLGRPRTVQVTENGLPIIASVSNEGLYMFSKTAVYAMTGDIPSEATYPKLLPGRAGCISYRGAVPFASGAIYATTDGIYYVEVPYGFDGSASQVRWDELTENVKPTYEGMIGTTSATQEGVIVLTHAGHIWVWRNKNYMHRTPEGKWFYGTYTGSDNAYAAFSHHLYGMIMVFDNVKPAVVGSFTTDGGTNADGSNGTAYTWSVTSKKFLSDMKLLRAYLKWEGTAGTITVAVTGESASQTLTFSGASAVANQPFARSGKHVGGRYFQVALSGTATDKVSSCRLDMVPASSRRGY